MSSWQSFLKADPIPWLLEPENPPVRYFTLTEILDHPSDDKEVNEARRDIMATGNVPKLLEGQADEGYWKTADAYYSPRYSATAWHFMLLAEFNANGAIPQIRKTADYLATHAQLENGGFCSEDISRRLPGVDGTLCFTGNMVWSFIR